MTRLDLLPSSMNSSTGIVPALDGTGVEVLDQPPEGTSPTYFQVVFLIIVLIVSYLGNIMVIFVIFKNNALRKPANLFTAGLALTDLIFIGCSIPAIDAGIYDRWRFGDVACFFNGILILGTGIASLYHMGMIAIYRYVNICQPKYNEKISKWQVAISIEICLWCLTFLVIILPGWLMTDIEYDRRTRTCIFSRKRWEFPLHVTIVGVFIPTNLALTCYLQIYKTIRQSKKKLITHAATDKDQLQEGKKLIRKQMKKVIGKFVVFLVFVVMFLPYSLVTIIDFFMKIPDDIHMVAALLICLNSAVNPFIYGLMNTAFKAAYLRVFNSIRKHLCCCSLPHLHSAKHSNSVEPMEHTSGS